MVEHDPQNPKGEVVVINTCGFTGDAKKESIETILGFAHARKAGKIRQLYVMGCLTERYAEELRQEIPEVDKFYGKFNWKQLVADLGVIYRADLMNERSLTTPRHHAYLKISEGCNRSCSFCAIPLMTGNHVSRSIDSLVDETRRLAAKGVKELQVIAQDISSYGTDLYKKRMLAPLVEELAAIEGIEWIRLHYAYPAGFPRDVLDVMASNPKICNYLDIALQHISDPMLNLMRRNISKAETVALINEIREKVPGIHLRTTLLTGHPGETKACFDELMKFVEDTRFERLGVFTYSHEDNTYSYNNYKDNISAKVKQARADAVMELQRSISLEHNLKKIGSRLKVIIDREEGDFFIGRSEFDSPEVDPEVVIEKRSDITIGEFYNVEITSADDYDLNGMVIK